MQCHLWNVSVVKIYKWIEFGVMQLWKYAAVRNVCFLFVML